MYLKLFFVLLFTFYDSYFQKKKYLHIWFFFYLVDFNNLRKWVFFCDCAPFPIDSNEFDGALLR